MTQDEVLQIFKERGALLQGHFKLTSGLHSDSYLQCALLCQYACDADRLGAELARKFKDPTREKPITAVVAPAIGGIVLGYVIARSLNARALYAERVAGPAPVNHKLSGPAPLQSSAGGGGGKFALRR
ncbi:MAG TPA: hypothetical protein VMU17_05890, partial [Elusimicrobiota bacterium]|nr:hypothetical protein [Elusimicrobiota bacterium]